MRYLQIHFGKAPPPDTRSNRQKIWFLVNAMESMDEAVGCVEWLVERILPDMHLKYRPGRKPPDTIVNLAD